VSEPLIRNDTSSVGTAVVADAADEDDVAGSVVCTVAGADAWVTVDDVVVPADGGFAVAQLAATSRKLVIAMTGRYRTFI
jgi:hypothetical protein